jgi:retron-type reverse transcriptase
MDVLTKQLQITELAAARPEESFTSLNHYLDMDWMKEAYRRTRRESAAGVDGKTMEQYGKELESNNRDLIGRAKSGRYHAPPVRRVHIPKRDGKETRPIGNPTTEDKVLKGDNDAGTDLRTDSRFSFGFRPGRSAQWLDTSGNSAWIIR